MPAFHFVKPENTFIMKEISDIYLGRMNNGAHFTYVSNLLARAEGDRAVSTKAAAQVAALKAAVEQEDADLKLSRKSMLSDEIAAADAKRDDFYVGYKKAVQGFLRLPVGAMANAAKVLSQHIKDYAIDPKMQLDRETGMLKNFIADLEGTYKQQVEALSLGEFVTCMKEANERVNRLLDQRGNEQLGATVGALKASRKATDEACRMLVKMVNALALVEGEKDYAAFIDRTNTEIVRYKREVLGQVSAPAGTDGSGSGSDSGTGGGTGTGGSGNTGGNQGGSSGGNTGGGSDGGDAMV